jgi:hypothetical protein
MAAIDKNPVFDLLSYALEEAAWCAENEKRAYIIRPTKRGYRVSVKSRMQKNSPHIEVGFRDATNEN